MSSGSEELEPEGDTRPPEPKRQRTSISSTERTDHDHSPEPTPAGEVREGPRPGDAADWPVQIDHEDDAHEMESESELQDQEEGGKKECALTNTESCDRWAIKNLRMWIWVRNQRCQDDQCPEDLMEREDAELLNKWLAIFVNEVRRSDGSQYSPKSVYSLLCGLQRYLRRHSTSRINILDADDPRFRRLGESVRSYRALKGLEMETQRPEVITKEEENRMWELGALGDGSPKALLRSMYFLNVKNFGIRGGQHRKLKLSQFKREGDHWEFTEEGSKLFQGKVAHLYPCRELGRRCHVYLLDLYVQKLPVRAMEKDAFYFLPLQNFQLLKPWYTEVPMGKNTLGRLVMEVCSEVGIEGRNSQSLQANTLTQLYKNGINVIQGQRGLGLGLAITVL